MTKRLLPLTVVLGLAAAAPAPAAAEPALDPVKPCYVSVKTAARTFDSEPVPISGSGFTPGVTVDLRLDGALVGSVIADDLGGLPETTIDAPVVKHGQRPFTVAATERDATPYTVTVSSLVSDLSVKVRPQRARPRHRVRFRGRGFTRDAPVFAHYVLRGRVRETVRLKHRPTGPCGTLSVRRRQFPFRPRVGTWTLQIDQQRELSDLGPLVTLAVDVRRTPRTRR